MAEHSPRLMAGILRRSIPSQKAARVRLETGPPPLADRLAALAASWEVMAGQPGWGDQASTLEMCAAELRTGLGR